MKNGSLRRRFIPQMLLIMLALVAYMIVYHANITSVLRERASNEGSLLCGIYIHEIDDVLNDIRRWLTVQFESDEGVAQLSSADEVERVSAQKRYAQLLSDGTALYPSIDMAFIISSEYPTAIFEVSDRIEYDRYDELKDAVESVAQFGKSFETDWTVVPAGNSCAFLTSLKFDTALIGICIEPETLLSSVPFNVENNYNFVLAKHSGYVVTTSLPDDYGEGIDLTGELDGYYVTGEDNNVIVSGAISEVGPFRLMMVAKDSEIQADIAWTRWTLMFLIALCVVSVGGMLYSLRRSILLPLDRLTRAISRFGLTRERENILVNGEAREFVEINSAFNHMADQIEHLKIENYEQVIRKQQMELRFYQTQIKPHFILNCLTTINNLALQGKNEQLYKFIADFSGFARCMFRNDFTLITVAEELRQTDYFIGMQLVRYPERIFYLADADNEAKAATIPAMLIQTLVENSVKHGMGEGQLSVFVKCSMSQGVLTVQVEDSGPGFSAASLDAINTGAEAGFGIRNLRSTLELYYAGRASFKAENIPGSGAKVTLTLPGREE
ncbi:MAG: histidine kinase [Clostridia bacterium]|nr:histidine kinase [Clostridia bacterium]